MQLTLRPMSRDRLAEYLQAGTDEYIADLIAAGTPPEVARKNASDVMAESFPDGVPANGNEIFDVMDDSEPEGILWLANQGDGTWFIYDIEILEQQRGNGYGRATMLAAEDHVRASGGTTLELHVFGSNRTARQLYESLGYEPTRIRMRKQL